MMNIGEIHDKTNIFPLPKHLKPGALCVSQRGTGNSYEIVTMNIMSFPGNVATFQLRCQILSVSVFQPRLARLHVPMLMLSCMRPLAPMLGFDGRLLPPIAPSGWGRLGPGPFLPIAYLGTLDCS
ncbi:hypothetical protein VFPPC_16188 [Pochonia chlamydosporia 170]|uniref:Uncharacterized protein n=1 Tax=Pochonia chlamydosporia 170 TaxID=1380566 RepID=A0A179FFS8_METCM|nr:hypothetical protein VFPPC_16188 [Pochonia chlamydosporia 170]OAQ64267.1 hypothetical protein VFPPC_16188 [Pochonia chlamydosporia 170]